MASEVYDEFADAYVRMVDQMVGQPHTVMGVAAATVLDIVGDVAGRDIADVGCGEGHLARMIAGRGGRVTAIDRSAKLVEVAKQRTSPAGLVHFGVADARRLASLPTEGFDVVICNLVLMDVDDFEAIYRAVHRVLRPAGRFIFTITHPCFQSPATDVVLGEQGLERRIRTYATEGQWFSGDRNTIRGRVGAYHRRLSTYVNALVEAGFVVERIVEPTLPPADYEWTSSRVQIEIPSVLAVSSSRVMSE